MKSRAVFLALLIAVPSYAADNSPFYQPIRSNDLPALRELIRDPGVKATDSRGNTPLMYAASLGSAESMRLLLDAGADPNAPNLLAATPLMWCAGDAVKVRMLLAKGAQVNVRSKLGRTPLLIAATYDGATEAARLLIEKSADVNAADENGASVLEQAAGSNNIEVVRFLLAKGAKVNAVDKLGFTPLLAATGNGDRNTDLVKLLIEHGAAVNVVSGDTVEKVKNGPLALGRITALHQAAQIAPFEAVEALVKAGADVNAKDIRGATPLVWAVATDHPDPKVVQLLLAKGAAREPALEWVRRNQNPAILPLFGLKPDPVAVSRYPEAQRSAREAVMKALAVSQPVAGKFIATGGCVSCHAQYLNGVAAAAAKAASLKPDTALEEAATHDTVSIRGGMHEGFFQVQDPPDGVEGVGFSFLQIAAEKVPLTLQIDSMIHHLGAMQRKEGSWPFFDGRPPIEGSAFGQTARAIQALRAYPIPGRKAEFDDRIARAAAWLENSAPLTTEDRTNQILGLVWAGRTAPAKRIQELVSRQRPDGGWAQTDQLGTDAWATGEVLWALHESGMAPPDPVYKRGVDYLLRTQKDDGTWHVATRSFGFQPYFQSGFPYDHDQWISEAGTAMATIALTYAVN